MTDKRHRQPNICFCADVSMFSADTLHPADLIDGPESSPAFKASEQVFSILFDNPRATVFLALAIDFAKANPRRWLTLVHIIRDLGGNIEWGEREVIAKKAGVSLRQLTRWINEFDEIVPGMIQQPIKQKKGEKRT